MNKIDQVRIQLVEFKECDKFKIYGHLQPAVANSTEKDKRYIIEEMNLCADQLLKHLEQDKPKDSDLKKIVRNSMEKIEDAELDTEDREFCYELYFKIGKTLGIDIEDKSKSLEQKLMDDLLKQMKKGGLNPDDFLKK